jgi:formylglycine-generating enzyme required for sulfatase activity
VRLSLAASTLLAIAAILLLCLLRAGPNADAGATRGSAVASPPAPAPAPAAPPLEHVASPSLGAAAAEPRAAAAPAAIDVPTPAPSDEPAPLPPTATGSDAQAATAEPTSFVDAPAATAEPTSFVDARSGVEFVRVPAGSFLFGATPGDPWRTANDLPQRAARLERTVYFARTELTAAQFATYRKGQRTAAGDLRPAVRITRDEAIAFCQHYGYRLPTELEWERACRADTTTRFSWGDSDTQAVEHANGLCAREAGPRPDRAVFPGDDGTAGLDAVAQRRPNDYGLFDMLGNTWELCADAVSLGSSGPMRFAARGGSFREGPDGCRCSSRIEVAATYRADNLGVRVVLDDWSTVCNAASSRR